MSASRPEPRGWRRWIRIGGGVFLLLVVAWILLTGGDPRGIGRGPNPPDTSSSASAGSTPDSGLATVPASELPPEGRETLELIHDGGPFPHDRDGITFENREGILPEEERGYYSEYTVPTPGEDDRGARRIVTGEDGDSYYTDDHYASFRQIEEGQ